LPSGFVFNVAGRLSNIVVSNEAVKRAGKQISQGLSAATNKKLSQKVDVIIGTKGQNKLKSDIKKTVAEAQKALDKLSGAKSGKARATAANQVEKSLKRLKIIAAETGSTLQLLFAKKPNASAQIGSLKQQERQLRIHINTLERAAQAQAKMNASTRGLKPSGKKGSIISFTGSEKVGLTVDPRAKAAAAARRREEAARKKAAAKVERDRQKAIEAVRRDALEKRKTAKRQAELNLRVKEYVQLLMKADLAAEKLARKTGKTFRPRNVQQLQKQAHKDIFGDSGATDARSIKSKERLARASDKASLATRKQRGELSRLSEALKATSQAEAHFNRVTKNSATAMQKFGNQSALAIRRYAAYLLPTTGLFAVIGAVRQSIESFKEFEAEQTKLAQVLGVPQNSINDFTKSLLSLSTQTGIAGQDIVKVSRVLAQAGFGRGKGGEKDLLKATEAITRSQLLPTFGTTEEVVDGLVAVIKQYNLELQDTGKILDITNQLAKDFAVESKDIFEAVKRGGAVFATAGGSFEEFAGLMTVLRAKTRESAKMLGTFFKSVGSRIFRDDIEELLTNIDGRITQVDNITGRLRLLAVAFEKMDAREKIKAATDIAGVRQAARLVGILTAIAEEGSNIDIALAKAIGSAERDAAKRLDDVVVQFQKAQAAVNAAVIGFIETDTVKNLLSTFTSLISGIASIAGTLAPVLAPITSVLTVFAGASLAKHVGRGLGVKGFGDNRRTISNKQLELATNTNTTSVQRLTSSIDRLSNVESSQGAIGTGPGSPFAVGPGTGLGRHTRRASMSSFLGISPGGSAAGDSTRLRNMSLSNNALSAALVAFPGKTRQTLSRMDRFVSATQRRRLRNQLLSQGSGRSGLTIAQADAAARRRMGLSSAARERASTRRRIVGQNIVGGRGLGIAGRGGFGLGLLGSIVGGAMASSAIEDLERGVPATGKLMAGSILSGLGTGALGGGLLGGAFGPIGAGIGVIVGGLAGAAAGAAQALNRLTRIENERFDTLRDSGIEQFIKEGKLTPGSRQKFKNDNSQDFLFGNAEDIPFSLTTRRNRRLPIAGGSFPAGAFNALERAKEGFRPSGIEIDRLIKFPNDELAKEFKEKILAFGRGRINVLQSKEGLGLGEAFEKLKKEIFEVSDEFDSLDQVGKLLAAFGLLGDGIEEVPKGILSMVTTMERFKEKVNSSVRSVTTELGLFREAIKDSVQAAKNRTLAPDVLESLFSGEFTPTFGADLRSDAAAGELASTASRLNVTNKNFLSVIDEISAGENLVRRMASLAAEVLNPEDVAELVERVRAFTDEDIVKLGLIGKDAGNVNVKDLDVTEAMETRLGFLKDSFGAAGEEMFEALIKGLDPKALVDENVVQSLEAATGIDKKRSQVIETLNDISRTNVEVRQKELNFLRLEAKIRKKLTDQLKEQLQFMGDFEQAQAQRMSRFGLMDQADALAAGLNQLQVALLLDINNLKDGIQFVARDLGGNISVTKDFGKLRKVGLDLVNNVLIFQRALADLEVQGKTGAELDTPNVRGALSRLGLSFDKLGGDASRIQIVLASALDGATSEAEQFKTGLTSALSAGIDQAQRLGTEFRKQFDFITGLGQSLLSDPKKVQEQANALNNLAPSILSAINQAGAPGISTSSFTEADILNPAILSAVRGVVGNIDVATLNQLTEALATLVGTEDITGTKVSGDELRKLIQTVFGQTAQGLSPLIPQTAGLSGLTNQLKTQEETNKRLADEISAASANFSALIEKQREIVEFNAEAFTQAFGSIPDTINLVQEPILVSVQLTGADAIAHAISKQAQRNIGNAVILEVKKAFGEEGIPFPQGLGVSGNP
jgi:TP901 family phage tail tape measure protein